jgi:hypothetical protein
MRISATTLEAFRLYLTEDWMDEDALLDTIKGVFVPTPAMLAGRAYHSVLETPETYRVPNGYLCDGYQFDDATMQPMLDIIDRRGVFEVKTTKELEDVTLVAQADQLCGAHLHEFKTTGYFDIEKYTTSMQWRVMALLFEPLAIHYHVASLDDHGNGVVTLRTPPDHFSLYPYAELANDVRALLRECVEYVRLKGLDALLEERARTAA